MRTVKNSLRFRDFLISLNLLFCLCLSEPLIAAETHSLEDIMQAMRAVRLMRIRYFETRYLTFFDQPWKGTGFLYASAPEFLIKEQLFPERELMGADQRYLYYFQPKSGIHLQSGFENDDPVSLHVLAIQALVFGNIELLKRIYQAELIENQTTWSLILTPTHPEALEALNKIEISGPLGEMLESIMIFQSDGDKIHYQLEKPTTQPELKKQIQILESELKD